VINLSVINGIRHLYGKCKGYIYSGMSTPEMKYIHHRVLSGAIPDLNMLLPIQAGCLIYPVSETDFPHRYSDILHPEINSPYPDGAIQS